MDTITDKRIRDQMNEIIGMHNAGQTDGLYAKLKDVLSLELDGAALDSSHLDIIRAAHSIVRARGFDDLTVYIMRTNCAASGQCPGDVYANIVRDIKAAGARPKRSDFDPSPDTARGTVVLVACMPKSGSSFLSHALQDATGFKRMFGTFAYGQNEQELYLPYIRRAARQNTIIQQHVRATDANLALVRAFDIKVVFLVRNIFDALVSMRDMLKNDDVPGTAATFLRQGPGGLGDETMLHAVVLKFAHWYVEFYVSWARALRDQAADILPVSYDTLMPDKLGTLRAISDFAGLGLDEGTIARTLTALEADKQRIRFNKGLPGRGLREISPADVALIRDIGRLYDDVDLSPIGLEPPRP